MKCPLCPKEYQSENDLQRHIKKIHGLSVAVLKQHSNEEQSEFLQKCLKVLEESKVKQRGE